MDLRFAEPFTFAGDLHYLAGRKKHAAALYRAALALGGPPQMLACSSITQSTAPTASDARCLWRVSKMFKLLVWNPDTQRVEAARMSSRVLGTFSQRPGRPG